MLADEITAIATLVAAVGAVVAGVGALVVGWRNTRIAEVAKGKAVAAAEEAAASKRAIVRVGDDVHEVGKRIDGRLTELLNVTRANSFAKGHAEGIEAERTRGTGTL